MNKINLIGNLTRDPELSETRSGVAYCNFSIAVSRSFTNADGERETDFFDCVAWRGLAETIANYFSKGNKIGVSGRVEVGSYEDDYGNKRKSFKVVVEDFDFLTPKARDNEESERPPKRGKSKPRLEEFDDDGDIPF